MIKINRQLLKQQAKANVSANYWPWLLTALISIFIAFSQTRTQFQDGVDVGRQLEVRWLDVFELFLWVPFSRLALDLSKGTFLNIKDSLLRNEQWLRDIGASLVVGLFTFLWTLLFIIPGIIKWYEYAMVPYILAEDDSIGIMAAIESSKRMTMGYKWELFIMDWSFILWDITAGLTFGLAAFYSVPYQRATWAQYYLNLSRQ